MYLYYTIQYTYDTAVYLFTHVLSVSVCVRVCLSVRILYCMLRADREALQKMLRA